jgi:hypothetical protein
MRILGTTQGNLRIDIAASDADGEVHGDPPIVDSRNTDGGTSTNAGADNCPCLRQVRVRGLHPTVIDRHRAIADDDADE